MARFPNDYRIEVNMTPELMFGQLSYFWVIFKVDEFGKRCNSGGFGWEPTPEKAFIAAFTFYSNNFDGEGSDVDEKTNSR